MSTVSSILTSVGYDLKLSSTQLTDRSAELINYVNRIIRAGILPTLIRYSHDYGMKEWTTTETTAYLRRYSLPSDFVSFHVLYGVQQEDSGTLTSAASTTSVVLDTDASSVDDHYNGYFFRLTSGTYADEQTYIIDYDGSTRTATLSPALSGTPSTDNYVTFDVPETQDELRQLPVRQLYNEYSSTTSIPEAYALDRDSYLVLGDIPDNSEIILYGLYFYMPTLLTASTDSLPFDPIFDEIVRQYTSQIAMLRDEYDIKVEAAIMGSIQNEVATILARRIRSTPQPAQSKIRGSDD